MGSFVTITPIPPLKGRELPSFSLTERHEDVAPITHNDDRESIQMPPVNLTQGLCRHPRSPLRYLEKY
jgi:hypothetical protein